MGYCNTSNITMARCSFTPLSDVCFVSFEDLLSGPGDRSVLCVCRTAVLRDDVVLLPLCGPEMGSYDAELDSNKRPGKWLCDVVASRCGRLGDVTVDQGYPWQHFFVPASPVGSNNDLADPRPILLFAPAIQGHRPP